ncbi:MAG: tyrosine--tRNA ligase [Microthrixaceae bacterium]|nr:tyrosine--tRNA ligase [Microthrixaceae bacterium]
MATARRSGCSCRDSLDFTGSPTAATLVDNRDWTQDMGVLEFLRDVGKFVTVNTMLAKDSVRSRMERDSGISFTEFAYMLLQANDYRVLHERRGVDLQVAGFGPVGNITAGVDLIRRRTGDQVHGLTAPLIVRADGTKFGKSEGDNVWLSAELTSPYQMYQYLMNVGDDDVEQLLARLTTVPVPECAAVGVAHRAAPELRDGQRRLGQELTAMVHGPEVLGPIEAATAVAFGGLPTEAEEATFALLAREIPSQVILPW